MVICWSSSCVQQLGRGAFECQTRGPRFKSPLDVTLDQSFWEQEEELLVSLSVGHRSRYGWWGPEKVESCSGVSEDVFWLAVLLYRTESHTCVCVCVSVSAFPDSLPCGPEAPSPQMSPHTLCLSSLRKNESYLDPRVGPFTGCEGRECVCVCVCVCVYLSVCGWERGGLRMQAISRPGWMRWQNRR